MVKLEDYLTNDMKKVLEHCTKEEIEEMDIDEYFDVLMSIEEDEAERQAEEDDYEAWLAETEVERALGWRD